MVWNVLKQFSSATFSKPTLLITWYLDKLSHWQTCRFLWLPKPPNESTKPGPDPWMVKGCLWKVPLQVPTIVSTWRDLCNTVANILHSSEGHQGTVCQNAMLLLCQKVFGSSFRVLSVRQCSGELIMHCRHLTLSIHPTSMSPNQDTTSFGAGFPNGSSRTGSSPQLTTRFFLPSDSVSYLKSEKSAVLTHFSDDFYIAFRN